MFQKYFTVLTLFLSLLLLTLGLAHADTGKAHKTAEGLYTEPWFNETSGNLAEDLQAAISQNKTLTIIWEQRGCSYCQKMHEVNLQIEATVQFIQKSFYIVLLNMRGERQITDFDGTPIDEAKLARKHRIMGTPTIEFRNHQAEEVFRMPGYAEPLIFLGVFDYVARKEYKNSSLIPWLKKNYLGE